MGLAFGTGFQSICEANVSGGACILGGVGGYRGRRSVEASTTGDTRRDQSVRISQCVCVVSTLYVLAVVVN